MIMHRESALTAHLKQIPSTVRQQQQQPCSFQKSHFKNVKKEEKVEFIFIRAVKATLK